MFNAFTAPMIMPEERLMCLKALLLLVTINFGRLYKQNFTESRYSAVITFIGSKCDGDGL